MYMKKAGRLYSKEEILGKAQRKPEKLERLEQGKPPRAASSLTTAVGNLNKPQKELHVF